MKNQIFNDYNYDFNYSINFDIKNIQQNTENLNDQRRQFIICNAKINDFKLIANRQIKTFFTLLGRQPSYINLGYILTQIVEIQFELGLSGGSANGSGSVSGRKNRNIDKIQKLRQQLCAGISQMNGMLGKEKNYYINIVILFMMVVILKILKRKYETMLDKIVLFHFLHWQIKGQHSTNTLFQNLYKDILNQEHIDNYFEDKIKKSHHGGMQQSLSFKHIKGGQKDGLKMKDNRQSTNFFNSVTNNMANHHFDKENNVQFGNVIGGNIPSSNCFKKPLFKLDSHNGVNQMIKKSDYPKAFSKCMLSK